MPCCVCPKGECPADCPFLDLFPSDNPCMKRDELVNLGFELEFIEHELREAKESGGGLDAQKEVIERLKCVDEASKKHPLGLIGIFKEKYDKLEEKRRLVAELRLVVAKNQEIIESSRSCLKEITGHDPLDKLDVEAKDPDTGAAAVVIRGFPGLSRCTNALDEED